MLRFGFTLFLLFLNACLVCTYYYNKGTKTENVDKIVFNIQNLLSDIQFFKISNFYTNTDYEFRNTNDGWKLEKPFNWTANSIAINKVIQQLSSFDNMIKFNISKKNELETLKNYGLDNPTFKIQIKNSLNEYLLLVSDKVQSNGKLYLLDKQENTIYVCDPTDLSTLNFDLTQWCNTNVFNNDFRDIVSIEYKSIFNTVNLFKNNTVWMLKDPVNAKANFYNAEFLAGQIRHMELIRFLTTDECDTILPKFQDSKQAQSLTVCDAMDTKTLKIVPYNAEDNLFAVNFDLCAMPFIVRAKWLNLFKSPQDSLRDRCLFDFNQSDLTEIIYSSYENQVALQKLENNHWIALDYYNNMLTQTERANFSAIYTLLNQLNTTYVEEFLDFNQINLHPNKTVNFKLVKNDEQINFCIYQQGSEFYLKKFDENTLFKITLTDPELLTQSFDKLRNKVIWLWDMSEHLKSIYIRAIPTYDKISSNINVRINTKLETMESIFRILVAKSFCTFDAIIKQNKFTWLPINCVLENIWPYQIKFETVDGLNNVNTYTLFLSERSSGNMQLASFNGKTFWLNLKYIRAIFSLIEQPKWQQFANFFNKDNV